MDTPRRHRRPDYGRAAVAGVLAGALALGVAEVLAALISPSSAPILAVGSLFVDNTPGWLKDFAIQTFGTNDKLALLVGMSLTIAAFAAVAGALSLRRRLVGTVLVGVLGAVAAVAAVTRSSAGPLDVVPSLVGVTVGALALRSMVDRVDRVDASAAQGFDRRSFLTAAGVTAGLAVLTGAGGRLLGRARRDVTATRTSWDLPAAADPAPVPPPSVSVDVAGMPPWQTPNPDFYRIDTALRVPRINPDDWTLRVHGMVEEEVEITFAELLAEELTEQWITLTCVSNEVGGDLIGNAVWRGYPIRKLLERARPTGGADMVLSRSDDGFSAGTPLQALTDDRGSLLAVSMNGEPLPLEHGFPVRMVVPGLYGYVSATKWVTEMEVTTYAADTAYWTDRGWAAKGPILTQSRIDVPGSFAKLEPGTVVVAGTAWAQQRGIDAVEVQVDDGEWAPATLAGTVSIDTWRQWFFEWEATSGNHTLRVRATDSTGEVQTQEQAPPIPSGATGWHNVVVQVA
jgi:DMSO/TMAO reductase YedYZ molybdopterin-dependent catalytic subunit